MNNSKSTNNGIGFCGLLTLIFLTLKLIGIISWSWVWVLSPIWIPTTLVVLLIVVLIFRKEKKSK